jgi:hypothetical protein
VMAVAATAVMGVGLIPRRGRIHVLTIVGGAAIGVLLVVGELLILVVAVMFFSH